MKRKFTVQEYHKMAEVGILRPDENLELINGQILNMSPIGSQHAACVKALTEAFYNQLLGKVTIGVQDPIHINNLTEPEPDISILKKSKDRYASGHPKPDDVLLIVEVADSSLKFDKEVKLPIYAMVGIPEYWIINLEANCIEVYANPKEKQYTLQSIYNISDTISTKLISDLKVADILG